LCFGGLPAVPGPNRRLLADEVDKVFLDETSLFRGEHPGVSVSERAPVMRTARARARDAFQNAFARLKDKLINNLVKFRF
jgi:hypothetical protein